METTPHFDHDVLARRAYIDPAWCERIIRAPLRREQQADGRIRFWGIVSEFGNRVFRVVTLEDGETVLTAFPDRNFRLSR